MMPTVPYVWNDTHVDIMIKDAKEDETVLEKNITDFFKSIGVVGLSEGNIKRASDNKIPKTVAFVQCAGSRDENHLPYCSAVCCSASLKQALYINDLYPETRVKIFYIDLRVTGRNEDFLQKVQKRENIEMIKGKVALITGAARGIGTPPP